MTRHLRVKLRRVHARLKGVLGKGSIQPIINSGVNLAAVLLSLSNCICFSSNNVSQKWGSPVLKLDYLLRDVVEQQRPLDWDMFWKKQATQVGTSGRPTLERGGSDESLGQP